MINLEETLDQDLDAILGELNALENNFGDGDPDISRDSDTSSKASKASSTISSSSTVVQVVRPSTTSNPPNSSSCSTIPENRNIMNPKSPKTSIPGKYLSQNYFIIFYCLIFISSFKTKTVIKYTTSHLKVLPMGKAPFLRMYQFQQPKPLLNI